MKNIFVGNLNSSTSEGALFQLFAAFGPLDQVKIIMDSYTGKSRGSALWRCLARKTEPKPSPPGRPLASQFVRRTRHSAYESRRRLLRPVQITSHQVERFVYFARRKSMSSPTP
jgi:hypothetical protein